MKKFLSLALFAFSLSAFANPAGQFVGRYFVEGSESCRLGSEGDRAYIKLETDEAGRRVLEINIFGGGARMDSFPVENTVATSFSTGGHKITDRTNVRWLSSSKMQVTTITDAPTMGIRYSISYGVALVEGGVKISEKHKGSGGENSTCVLVRTP